MSMYEHKPATSSNCLIRTCTFTQSILGSYCFSKFGILVVAFVSVCLAGGKIENPILCFVIVAPNFNAKFLMSCDRTCNFTNQSNVCDNNIELIKFCLLSKASSVSSQNIMCTNLLPQFACTKCATR